jgi:hypothetical protein
MLTPIGFRLSVIFLLLFPAIIYFAVGFRNGHLEITYLLPNYIFMAWPHLLVSSGIIWTKTYRSEIITTLIGLNLILLAFQLWVLFSVPGRESGLAWVLYIPISAVFLIIAYGISRIPKQ